MKRLTITLLSFVLVFATLLLPVGATTATDTDLKSPETTAIIGYSAALVEEVDLTQVTDIKSYNGNNNYKITDAQGLVMFAHLVSSTYANETETGTWKRTFYGKTIYLANDIDMLETLTYKYVDGKLSFDIVEGDETSTGTASSLFVPIGASNSATFKGSFDGQGHTISNLTVLSNTLTYVGLFGHGTFANIKNVIMDRTCAFSTSVATSYVGGIAGFLTYAGNEDAYAQVTNCLSMAAVSSTGASSYIGGIVGNATGTTNKVANIKNCTNASDSVSGANYVGGIAGLVNTGLFSNCRNVGDITNSKYGAGMIGRVETNITIQSCVNNGDIVGTSGSGGIIGVLKANSTGSIDANTINYGNAKNAIIASAGSTTEFSNEATSGTQDQTLINQMLGVAVQAKANATAGYMDLRIISSIDTLDYEYITFEFKFNGGEGIYNTTYTSQVTTVYTSIKASESDTVTEYSPYEVFAPNSKYFSTLTVTAIPYSATAEGVTNVTSVEITVKAKPVGGTEISGTVGTISNISTLLPTA